LPAAGYQWFLPGRLNLGLCRSNHRPRSTGCGRCDVGSGQILVWSAAAMVGDRRAPVRNVDVVGSCHTRAELHLLTPTCALHYLVSRSPTSADPSLSRTTHNTNPTHHTRPILHNCTYNDDLTQSLFIFLQRPSTFPSNSTQLVGIYPFYQQLHKPSQS
jgi:hypothetical protein